MPSLTDKLKRQDLSGLDALEYLRQVRGTSKRSLPESSDPGVQLVWGRGYRIITPSTTVEEILAASPATEPAAPPPVEFHPGFRYVPKEPREESIELVGGQIVPSCVYVRRRIEPEAVVAPVAPAPAEPVAEERQPENEPAGPPALPQQKRCEWCGLLFTPRRVSRTFCNSFCRVAAKRAKHGKERTLNAVENFPKSAPPAARTKPQVQKPLKTKDDCYANFDLERGMDFASTPPATALSVTPPKVTIEPRRARDFQGRASAAIPRRARMPIAEIAAAQNGLCVYGEHRFGELFLIGGQVKTLRAVEEHFEPYSLAHNDTPENIVAACQVCNEIKSDLIFKTVPEARAYISGEWLKRGHVKCPPLLPFRATTKLNLN